MIIMMDSDPHQFIWSFSDGLILSLTIDAYMGTVNNWSLVRVKKFHHKLTGDGQKDLHHQKPNIAEGSIPKSRGYVVTFKVNRQ